MQIFDIPLGNETGEGAPYLTAMLQKPFIRDIPGRLFPAMVVYPGGGYSHYCEPEGLPIALQYVAAGYQVFILYYSLAPKHYPAQLLDGARALNLLHSRAEEWFIDPNRIAVCGSSAGGHAAAMLCCLWNDPIITHAGLSAQWARPNAAILNYPVITSRIGECHEDSFRCLLGEKLRELRGALSLETRVSSDTPPTFLWATATDQTVPCISSMYYAMSLAANHIPVEFHLLPSGPHGLALANHCTCGVRPEKDLPEAARWVEWSLNWLDRTLTTKNGNP